eukprot:180701-Amphidinium_carterae.1
MSMSGQRRQGVGLAHPYSIEDLRSASSASERERLQADTFIPRKETHTPWAEAGLDIVIFRA